MSKYQFTLISFYQINNEQDIVRNIVFLNLLEKWKKSVDKGKSFGALFIELSKAFDCLDHELLTEKTNTYGFSQPALRLIHDYISNRKQRKKIGDNLVYGQKYLAFHKSQFLVHFLKIFSRRISFFYIFLADLFLVVKDIDISSDARDSAPFIVKNDIDNVNAYLEQASGALFNRFKNNRLKNNIDKCHVLVSMKKFVSIKI